ncbi:MAG TPA: alpha-ketoacid dehydrogenase subunit beta [Symbiobacteriaceae bacterium]|nr:alpha-ketoacid dehydrogenase subunit beta [Symbiobacteriaceae bacterium]
MSAIATRTASMAQAINEAIRQEMRRDPKVILFGEDVAGGPQVEHLKNDEAWGGVMGVTRGIVKEFGRERVLDTPISESGFIGAAVGAAATGLRPIAEMMFVGFVGVCYDQLLNQASKLRYMFGGKAKVPMVIRTMVGAGFRAAAQHSQMNVPLFAHIPGIKVVLPSTPRDAKGLLAAAVRDDNPVIFMEHLALYNMEGELPEGEFVIPLGKGEIKREGKDITVVAMGKMVHTALEAAKHVEAKGISVEVIDPRTLVPLDEALIFNSVKKTGRLVVVDEDNPVCSMGSEIIARVACEMFDHLDAHPVLVSAPHTPVPFSPPLEDAYIPSAAKVEAAIMAVRGR